MNCLFCKIIAGEIPSYTVYEDDVALAVLDIHPCSKGHAVVVPKKHFSKLDEMNVGDFTSLMQSVRNVQEKVQNVLKPDGMNIGINNGSAAGQSVPHVHWHIIPRYEGDGGGSMHSIVHSKDVGEVGKVATLFL